MTSWTWGTLFSSWRLWRLALRGKLQTKACLISYEHVCIYALNKWYLWLFKCSNYPKLRPPLLPCVSRTSHRLRTDEPLAVRPRNGPVLDHTDPDTWSDQAGRSLHRFWCFGVGVADALPLIIGLMISLGMNEPHNEPLKSEGVSSRNSDDHAIDSFIPLETTPSSSFFTSGEQDTTDTTRTDYQKGISVPLPRLSSGLVAPLLWKNRWANLLLEEPTSRAQHHKTLKLGNGWTIPNIGNIFQKSWTPNLSKMSGIHRYTHYAIAWTSHGLFHWCRAFGWSQLRSTCRIAHHWYLREQGTCHGICRYVQLLIGWPIVLIVGCVHKSCTSYLVSISSEVQHVQVLGGMLFFDLRIWQHWRHSLAHTLTQRPGSLKKWSSRRSGQLRPALTLAGCVIWWPDK